MSYDFITIGQLLENGEVTIKTGPFGTQLKASDYVAKGTPVINVRNIGLGTVVEEKLEYISDITRDRLKDHIVRENDIVFGRKGAVERHSFIDYKHNNWFQGSDCIRLRVNSGKIYPRFMSYYFLTNDHKNAIMQECAHGTIMASLNQSILKQMKLPMPKYSEQKAIAATLSCLDDKIELNNRINKNLEEMAQAIFKSWFVDFEPFQNGEFEDSELGRIPKGWKVGTLGEIADITMGQSPSGSSYNEDKDGEVFYQGRTDFGQRYPTVRLYTTEPKRMANKSDILLSVRAPVGDVNVAGEKCCIGRGLAALRSKNRHQSFLLYQLLNLKDRFKVYDGEGTVFGSINKDALNNMLVCIPDEVSVQKFQDVAGKLDEVIENNSNQTNVLVFLRDTLLPKLMSGEIRVPVEAV